MPIIGVNAACSRVLAVPADLVATPEPIDHPVPLLQLVSAPNVPLVTKSFPKLPGKGLSASVDCFKCASRVEINEKLRTKYWVCHKCKQMNKCENLIRQTIRDTVFDAKIIDEEN